MELHAVIDTKGSGRIVGVFSSRKRARRVANLSLHYYQLHTVVLNKVNPDALGWTDNDLQRAALRRLVERGV